MAGETVLEHVNTLPRPERQPPVNHGNDLARAGQRHSQVRGGVVAAFRRVDVVAFVLRHQPLEEFVQIGPGAPVGVFIDDQTCARVLNENRGRTGPHAAFAHHARDFLRDFIGAFAASADRECLGVRVH
jgi:hypothetical protein